MNFLANSTKQQKIATGLVGLFILLIVGIIVIQALNGSLFAGADNPPQNMAMREELQRYFGYEKLPFQYLSLPYDLTINTNEQGNYLDIGFLMMMFLPLLFLWGLSSKLWQKGLFILACVLLLAFSTSTAFIFGPTGEKLVANSPEFQQYLESTSFGQEPVGLTCAYIYSGLYPIYSLFENILTPNTLVEQRIVYPLLILLFVGFFLLLQKRISPHRFSSRVLTNLLFGYLFLWLLLAAGIIWYGFMILPLSLLIIFGAISKYKKEKTAYSKWMIPTVLGFTAIWIIMAFANRISNISPGPITDDTGKRLFDPAFVQYQVGDWKAEQVREAFYPNLSNALKDINGNESALIYDVSTLFSFFINKSDKRCFSDRYLEFFQQMQNKYTNKSNIVNALKASDFRYIIVDLKLPSIDHTPEQSLKKRFDAFLNFLYNNPQLTLIATDRKITARAGNQGFEYAVFGEVIDFGKYAIFKIN